METEKRISWNHVLSAEIQGVSEKLGLDDVSTSTLRDFVTGLSKEQFRKGCKSGYAFACRKHNIAQTPTSA